MEALGLFYASIHLTYYASISKKPEIYCSSRKFNPKRQTELEESYGWNPIACESQKMKGFVEDVDMIKLSSTRSQELNDLNDKILSACPSLHEVYWPSFFTSNAHLQLIPFSLFTNIQKNFPPVKYVEENFALEDGENVVLSWLVPNQTTAPSISDAGANEACKVLILHHGAYSRSNNLPGFTYIREAIERGFIVLIYNRRGHMGRLTMPCFNFFGSASDVRYIVDKAVRTVRPNARVVMLGISAGSGLVARYMGEQGIMIKKRQALGAREGGCAEEWRDPTHERYLSGYVESVIGIAPGYNIEKCMGRFGFPYSTVLRVAGKHFFLNKNQKVLQAAPGGQFAYDRCMAAEDFQAWLSETYTFANTNHHLAPEQGNGEEDNKMPSKPSSVPQIGEPRRGQYSCIAEYMDYHNPMRTVKHIVQPCLFINTEDDPLCKIENVYENIHILSGQDSEHSFAASGAVVVTTKTGSHCSFLENKFLSLLCGNTQPHHKALLDFVPGGCSWSDRVVGEYFEAVLEGCTR